VARFFTFVDFPHSDNVAIRATRSPDHHHHLFAQYAVGDVPRLTVVPTVVLSGIRRASKHEFRFAKINATSTSVLSRFRRVEGDLHLFMWPPILALSRAVLPCDGHSATGFIFPFEQGSTDTTHLHSETQIHLPLVGRSERGHALRVGGTSTIVAACPARLSPLSNRCLPH